MRFSEVFCGFSPSRESMKMAATMNATEHNNLPVLYNVTSGTVILSQHRHYVYIYNIFPYHEAIQWCKM